MEKPSQAESLRWNARLATLASFFLVSLMIACIVSSLLLIVQLIYPGLAAGYLVPVCIVIGLEASLGQRRLRNFSFPQPEWIAYRTAEFVTIILVLRLVVYSMSGFQQLWIDLQGWPASFWESMLTMDFMIVLFLAFFAWGANHMLSEDILLLESDEERLNKEMLGVEVEERSQAQQRLRDMVVFLGCGLVLATTVVRIAGRSDQASFSVIRATFINVVVYFLLALVLFSLTYFSVLRMNWIIQRSQVHQGMASRWFLYSLLFIGVLAVIVGLLPTSYSQGLLGTLSSLFYALLNGLRFLITLILFPFVLFVNWLMSLFRSSKAPDALPPIAAPTIPTYQPGFHADWFELIKSLVFWSTLIGLIVFSLYYFMRENRESIQKIRRIPLALSIENLIRRLITWIKGMNRRISISIDASLGRFRRPSNRESSGNGWRFANPRNLTTRQRVIFFYLAMLRRGGEHGVARQPSQTPNEYALQLENALHATPAVEGQPVSDISVEVNSLTEEFLEARFSQHPITMEQASLARSYWDHIRRAMQARLQGKGRQNET
jgi:Domain of unknown function (DUF4129)